MKAMLWRLEDRKSGTKDIYEILIHRDNFARGKQLNENRR